MNHDEFKLAIGVLSAIVSWGGWKFLWPFFKKVYKWIVEQAKMPKMLLDMMVSFQKQLDTIKESIKLIEYESQTNDGGSMKDDQNLIRTTLNMMVLMHRSSETRAIYESRLVNGKMKAIYVSPKWIELTGQTYADTEDGGWLKCVAMEDQERVRNLANEAERNGTIFQASYQLVNCMYGGRVPVYHEGTPLKTSKGLVNAWFGLITPIEEAEGE